MLTRQEIREICFIADSKFPNSSLISKIQKLIGEIKRDELKIFDVKWISLSILYNKLLEKDDFVIKLFDKKMINTMEMEKEMETKNLESF